MNIKLTLGERLKDLRVERNLKLETLAEQTGLSKSALSKYESDDVTDLSIYAVTTLAEFYGVTTDYLLGVTENKKRPDAVLSDLHLSDGAVDVLRNGKFNHRLLCELIVHENFQRFMTDLEIYVDGYVSANIQNLNDHQAINDDVQLFRIVFYLLIVSRSRALCAYGQHCISDRHTGQCLEDSNRVGHRICRDRRCSELCDHT